MKLLQYSITNANKGGEIGSDLQSIFMQILTKAVIINVQKVI